MKTQTDAIRAENKKAKGPFLLVMLVAGLVGGVVGFCGAFFGTEGLSELLSGAGTFFSRRVAHWLLVACAVALPAVCLPPYRKAKALMEGWDGEDETVADEAELLVSKAMWASGFLAVIGMFLISAVYAGVFTDGGEPGWGFAIGLVALVVAGVELLMIQRRLVDLARLCSPEKQGSVYDLKFREKWLDSCDEAEKLLIGQCAYRAYNAANTACMALWAVFTLAALFLDTGFLPVLAVCIVWGVAQWEYCRWSIRLSRPGATGQ